VIDKENAQVRSGIFMVDASKGFIKDGNKNRLREQDIHKIVDVFNRQLELPRCSRMVPVSEIASPANDYNLNIPRYIESSEPEDLHDLDAHLRGGIPNRDLDALQNYWQVFPSLRAELFEPGDRPGYSRAKVDSQQVKATVLKHPEFTAYSQTVTVVFESWRAAHETTLKNLKQGVNPKAVIRTLAEDLLERFASLPLLDKYDVYQRLMDYWAETMQDDVYLIGSDGWLEAAQPRAVVDSKDKNIREIPDLVVERKKYKMDLVPPSLIVARYFAVEQAAVDELEARRDAAERELEEFVEENSGEDGLLENAQTDKGPVTKASVSDRLKEAKDEPDSDDELKALNRCMELMDAEGKAAKAVKEAQAALDAKVLAHYGKLTESEVKTLAIRGKWLTAIRSGIDDEVQRQTLTGAGRIVELIERYGQTLGDLDRELIRLSERIELHLKQIVGSQTSAQLQKTNAGLVPKDWIVKKLREVATMRGRIGWQGLKQSEFTFNVDDPFLITGMNFKEGEIGWDEVYHVSSARYEVAPEIQLKPADLLMTKDGTIGKLLLVREIPHPGLATLNRNFRFSSQQLHTIYPL
jgi:type I restriction enzyme M protein